MCVSVRESVRKGMYCHLSVGVIPWREGDRTPSVFWQSLLSFAIAPTLLDVGLSYTPNLFSLVFHIEKEKNDTATRAKNKWELEKKNCKTCAHLGGWFTYTYIVLFSMNW